MRLRRLLGLGGDNVDPPKIGTVISTFSPQPGQRIEGEVLLRGGGAGPQESVRDIDFVHVAAPPLHQAVLDALGAEGHRVADAQLLDGGVPDVDQRHPWIQTFHLADGTGVPRSEVTFLTNPVGAMVYVRRPARHLTRWSEKPPAVPFPVAHHEAGEVDLGPRVREALDRLES